MNSRRLIATTRWALAFSALAGIVLVYHRWLHVNPTTVALTLLLFILVLAAEWGLRYAVVVSLVATALYNFFFLPPVGTFTISDPQNWLALFAFLSTAIIASRLSERARDEAYEARARQRELEVLLHLSQELLQTETIATLLSSVPSTVASVTAAKSGMLYLLEGDKVYQAGVDSISEVEIPHLRQLALTLPRVHQDDNEIQIPVRSGVKPRGLLVLRGVTLSTETLGAVGSLISISLDRAQAFESIAKNQAAKETERLRALMIDSITHELRTPLTSIKGAATTLLSEEVAKEERHELLAIIDEESDRLNHLVSEAVEMAQLDAQRVQMHFSPIRVRDLMDEALSVCDWIEDSHPLHIHIPADLRVHADPTVFQKVLCNLLENAAKYSGPGTPITISAETNDDRVAISVADQGIGIDASEQELIFERFYRARSHTTGISGTGMGLAISRAITEAHGGKLTVVSQPGHGSVFTAILPASTS
jgi:two-component system sensor histidine kinase KdpD